MLCANYQTQCWPASFASMILYQLFDSTLDESSVFVKIHTLTRSHFNKMPSIARHTSTRKQQLLFNSEPILKNAWLLLCGWNLFSNCTMICIVLRLGSLQNALWLQPSAYWTLLLRLHLLLIVRADLRRLATWSSFTAIWALVNIPNQYVIHLTFHRMAPTLRPWATRTTWTHQARRSPPSSAHQENTLTVSHLSCFPFLSSALSTFLSSATCCVELNSDCSMFPQLLKGHLGCIISSRSTGKLNSEAF